MAALFNSSPSLLPYPPSRPPEAAASAEEAGQDLAAVAAAEWGSAAEPTKTGGGGPAFALIGRKMPKSILLYPTQMIRLIDALPQAYQAFHRRDVTYRYVVTENKTQSIRLEVSLYKDNYYLFLKKYFRHRSADTPGPEVGTEDNDNPWIPTKSVVSFDPHRDDPMQLLDFVLTCCH